MEERGQKRRWKKRGRLPPQRCRSTVVSQQKNQPGKASAATAGEGSRASAAARLPRYPPYSTSGKVKDLRKWYKECDKVNEILKKDGRRLPRCTGIIIKQWTDDPGQHRAIIVTYSRVVCKEGRKLDPLPKLFVTLPDKKTSLDAELIYFNDHYDTALLCVHLDYPLDLPSIGRGPEYGQEVFVLARDGEVSLRVRCGNIKWMEKSDILGRDYYMFLSCGIPEGGNGGMVIDHDGEVRGVAVYWSPYPAVISVSIIEKCVDMFLHFDRVARPILGISFRTIAMLDVQCQEVIADFGINAGFLVHEVYNPVAEELGIQYGNVIISINGQSALTLPELEDYFLSLGSDYLKDTSICMKDAKLRVFDPKSGVERDVTLPVRFYDKAERDEGFERMGSDDTSYS